MRQPLGNRLLAIALAAVAGLFLFTYQYLDEVARNTGTPFLEPLIEELTAAFAILALLPAVAHLARRFRLDRPGWAAAIGAHLPAAILFGVTHTTLMWVARSALFPLAGLGVYDYGRMSVRYFMELPMQLIVYGTILIVVYLIDHVRVVRERELQLAQLETQLVRARLEALRAQIHPHFLFNALNAVSSVMYEDPATADTILSRLSELLRRSMRTEGDAFVALDDELATVDLYFDILRARFGEGLCAAIERDPAIGDMRVPPLVLQPLVENAVRHGRPPAGTAARIAVRALADGDGVILEVEDNGPGMPEEWQVLLGTGIGLTNTVERLRRTYGGAFEFDVRRGEAGGALLRVRLPAGDGG